MLGKNVLFPLILQEGISTEPCENALEPQAVLARPIETDAPADRLQRHASRSIPEEVHHLPPKNAIGDKAAADHAAGFLACVTQSGVDGRHTKRALANSS